MDRVCLSEATLQSTTLTHTRPQAQNARAARPKHDENETPLKRPSLFETRSRTSQMGMSSRSTQQTVSDAQDEQAAARMSSWDQSRPLPRLRLPPVKPPAPTTGPSTTTRKPSLALEIGSVIASTTRARKTRARLSARDVTPTKRNALQICAPRAALATETKAKAPLGVAMASAEAASSTSPGSATVARSPPKSRAMTSARAGATASQLRTRPTLSAECAQVMNSTSRALLHPLSTTLRPSSRA